MKSLDLKTSDYTAIMPYFDAKQCQEAQKNRLYAATVSFKWFMLIYMGHHLTRFPAPFQLQSYENAFAGRLLEIWPRHIGKSITWAVGYPLWVLLNNPFERNKENIVIISHAADLAEQWIEDHKKELTENPLILADYEPEKGERWRTDEIWVPGRGKIYSKGSGAQIRGFHPTTTVIDDLEAREEAESDVQREKTRRYFWRDVWGALSHQGSDKSRIVVIGTPVHPQALLPELYKKQDDWKKAWYGVYSEDGQPLWPEYMNRETIEKLRVEMSTDPGAFASEYLCQPIVTENPIFVKDWIKEYDPIDEDFVKRQQEEGFYTVLAVDPAISRRERADYTAIVTVLATKFKPNRYYVRTHGVTRLRGSIQETVQTIQRLYEQVGAHMVLIETVAFQQALADEWKRFCEDHHWPVNLRQIKPFKDKEVRARDIQSLFSRKEVYFNLSDPMQRRLVDELLMFPTGTHDDLVDALVYALAELKQRTDRVYSDTTKPDIQLAGTPRPYTGVI